MSAAYQPVHFPALPHQQVILNNLVCGLQQGLQTQISGAPCNIALQPWTQHRQFDLEFQLSVDGLPVRVQTTRDLFVDMAIGGTPLADLMEQLPDDLRMGCSNMAVERLMNDLRSFLQKDVRLTRISRSEHLIEGTPCLGLSFHTDQRAASGVLVINDQLHALLNQHLHSAEAVPADDLAIPMPVEIGITMLADTRLSRLSTGDLILFDRCWYKTRKYVFLRMTETSGYLAELHEHKVTLKQRLENAMSDDLDDFDLDDDLDLDDFEDDDDDISTPAAAAPQAAPAQEQAPAPAAAAPQAQQPPAQQVGHDDMKGLPVKLVFDVGQHEITLGEMGRIGPGYTFELNRNITSPVTMKANGKPFAECELVQVNNQLAARITRLL